MGKIADYPVINSFMQVEVPVNCKLVCHFQCIKLIFINGIEYDRAIVCGFYTGIGIHTDGGIQDGTAVEFRKGSHIGTSAG